MILDYITNPIVQLVLALLAGLLLGSMIFRGPDDKEAAKPVLRIHVSESRRGRFRWSVKDSAGKGLFGVAVHRSFPDRAAAERHARATLTGYRFRVAKKD